MSGTMAVIASVTARARVANAGPDGRQQEPSVHICLIGFLGFQSAQKKTSEKTRPGRDPSSHSLKQPTPSVLMSGPPAAVSHAELRFYREERPRVAALFSDTEEQDRELKRRWDVVSQHVTKMPSVSVATDDDDVSITKVSLSQPMTDVEAA
eukprot:3685135-Prymnesium_polylepis.1